MDEITTIFDKISIIQVDLAVIKSKILCLEDQEKRLRKQESYMSRTLGIISVLSAIIGALMTRIAGY